MCFRESDLAVKCSLIIDNPAECMAALVSEKMSTALIWNSNLNTERSNAHAGLIFLNIAFGLICCMVHNGQKTNSNCNNCEKDNFYSGFSNNLFVMFRYCVLIISFFRDYIYIDLGQVCVDFTFFCVVATSALNLFC